MKVRLLLLVAISLFLFFISLMFAISSEDPSARHFVWFFVSIVVIIYTISSDTEFNIAGHVLIVNRPFREQIKFELTQLRQWGESSYHIRGHQRKNLFLIFNNGQDIELSNRDYKESYETLYRFLRKEFPQLEKFNLTALQEIKFDSMHRALKEYFYLPENKYSKMDEAKNKSYSLEIFRMKMEGFTRDQIADRLFTIKANEGAQETLNKCKQIADRVIAI